MKNTAPAPGWTTQCRVSKVIDGDTVEVEVVRRVRVRLRDCWAPEIRTKDPTEKALAKASRESLVEMTRRGKATLHVPAHGEDFGEILTLSRVAGDVWIDDLLVNAEQVRRGHATKTKGGAS